MKAQRPDRSEYEPGAETLDSRIAGARRSILGLSDILSRGS